MSEWLTYRPEDFLLFSEQVYWRQFALHNEALWPAPVAAVLMSVLLVVAVLRPGLVPTRSAATLLALAWVSSGILFLGQRFATINFAATYVAPIFVLQGMLLLASASVREPVTPYRRADLAAAGVLTVWAALLHPLVPLLDGRTAAEAELVALAPDPTAILTLGFVLATRHGAFRFGLMTIPVLWCLASWLMLDTMGTWEAWIPLAAAVLAFGVAVWPRERPRSA